MVFLKVVLVGLASPRGLTVQCFPQEYFSPTPPFHFRCVGPCQARALSERFSLAFFVSKKLKFYVSTATFDTPTPVLRPGKTTIRPTRACNRKRVYCGHKHSILHREWTASRRSHLGFAAPTRHIVAPSTRAHRIGVPDARKETLANLWSDSLPPRLPERRLE